MLVLFAYAFISNVALAVVPHEPVVIWYGARLGVVATTLVATAGTVAAGWVDHRVFVALIQRIAPQRPNGLRRAFSRAPFAILALSGLTPLPFFPFKALAFTSGYPLGRYLGAVTARSLARYALLAWLGVVVRLPMWLFVVLFLALMIPSVRMLRWKRQRPSAN